GGDRGGKAAVGERGAARGARAERAERSAAEGELGGAGVGPRTHARDEVDRPAQHRAAVLHRDAAAEDLHPVERAEVERADVDRREREPRQRHAVDENLGLPGGRAAHGDGCERAQPPQGSHRYAHGRGERLGGGRGLLALAIDVDDGDEGGLVERPRLRPAALARVGHAHRRGDDVLIARRRPGEQPGDQYRQSLAHGPPPRWGRRGGGPALVPSGRVREPDAVDPSYPRARVAREGRSPGSRFILGRPFPTISSVVFAAFVPGYSSGGCAGLTPASRSPRRVCRTPVATSLISEIAKPGRIVKPWRLSGRVEELL